MTGGPGLKVTEDRAHTIYNPGKVSVTLCKILLERKSDGTKATALAYNFDGTKEWRVFVNPYANEYAILAKLENCGFSCVKPEISGLGEYSALEHKFLLLKIPSPLGGEG